MKRAGEGGRMVFELMMLACMQRAGGRRGGGEEGEEGGRRPSTCQATPASTQLM